MTEKREDLLDWDLEPLTVEMEDAENGVSRLVRRFREGHLCVGDNPDVIVIASNVPTEIAHHIAAAVNFCREIDTNYLETHELLNYVRGDKEIDRNFPYTSVNKEGAE